MIIRTHVDLSLPAEGREPRGLAIDSSGLIWIATNDGILNFDPDAGPSFSVSKSAVCVGDSIEFTNLSPPADSFKWQIDGQFVFSDSNLNYAFIQPGSHEVSLIAFQDSIQSSFSQFIEVKPAPDISLPTDSMACSNGIFLNPGVRELSYTWYNSNGTILALGPNFIADSSGTYIVVGSDVCGLSDTDSIQITLTKDTTCNCDCVWPGDVNADGWVNIYDFLILGAFINDTGLVRPNANTLFYAQGAPD
ncbi:MAG: hypothetical protein AAFN81_35200, partial [Bacteroidota bacterium]